MPLRHAKDYIETLKRKPAHERQRFALLASGAFTGLVALAWITTMSASGTFALAPSNQGNQRLSPAAFASSQDLSNLAGAAAAFSNGIPGAGGVVVVESNASSTLETQSSPAEQTVIPF